MAPGVDDEAAGTVPFGCGRQLQRHESRIRQAPTTARVADRQRARRSPPRTPTRSRTPRTATSRRTPRCHTSGTPIAAYSRAVWLTTVRESSDDRPAGCRSWVPLRPELWRNARRRRRAGTRRDHRSPGAPQRRRLGCRGGPARRVRRVRRRRLAVRRRADRRRWLLLCRCRPPGAGRRAIAARCPTTVPARWGRPGSHCRSR